MTEPESSTFRFPAISILVLGTIILIFSIIVPVSIMGLYSFENFSISSSKSSMNILESNAIINAKSVERFFEDKINDIEATKLNPIIKENIPILSKHVYEKTNPKYVESKKSIDEILQKLQNKFNFGSVMLTDQNGIVIYAAEKKHDTKFVGKHLTSISVDSYEEGKKDTYISELFQGKITPEFVIIHVSTPIMNDSEFLGILVFDMHMNDIFPTLFDPSVIGSTGEIILLKKIDGEIFVINALPFDQTAGMNRKISPNAEFFRIAQNSLLNNSGKGDVVDYRGVDTLVAWNSLPSLEWGIIAKIDSSEALSSVDEIKTNIILITVISTSIAVMVFIIFGRLLTKMLNNVMMNLVDKISKEEFDVNIKLYKISELNLITTSVNKIVNIFREKNKDLEEKQKVITNQLKELKSLDIQKEEFSSMITHELKTPLTPIRGYCEMLKDEGFGTLNKEQLDYVHKIDSSAMLLERLVGDVLDVQKLDLGRMRFSKESFDVDDFLDRLKQDSTHIMKDKGIEFVVTNSVKTALKTDQLRLLQILENLIKNSVDFVPSKNGKIEVDVKQENGKMIFHVKDNGIGIPKDKQGNLFKKFYQIDTTHTRKHGGTGLGLVICKGIAEGMGGKIWLESEEGRGTTFFFTIPKAD